MAFVWVGCILIYVRVITVNNMLYYRSFGSIAGISVGEGVNTVLYGSAY